MKDRRIRKRIQQKVTAMKHFILLITLLSLVLPCWVQSADNVFATRHIATKKKAVVLSALFPGLGQLSTDQKIKGTLMLVGEISTLAVMLIANENYNTRRDNFHRLKGEYAVMAAGNSRYDLAQQKWDELHKTNAVLDDLHLTRRISGAVAVGVYIYSLADMLLYNSPKVSAAPRWNLRAVPGMGDGPPKLVLMGSF